MIQLSEDQCRHLGGSEIVAVDPRTNDQYVLVPREIYDRFRGASDDDARLLAPFLAAIGKISRI